MLQFEKSRSKWHWNESYKCFIFVSSKRFGMFGLHTHFNFWLPLFFHLVIFSKLFMHFNNRTAWVLPMICINSSFIFPFNRGRWTISETIHEAHETSKFKVSEKASEYMYYVSELFDWESIVKLYEWSQTKYGLILEKTCHFHFV